MTRNTILYTGNFVFPDWEAGARRVLGIGRALQAGGFNVVFAGTEESGGKEDRQDDGTFVYQGFRYIPEVNRTVSQSKSRISRWVKFHLNGLTAMRRLRMFDPAGLQAVIVYNGSSLLLWQLRRFSRRYRVPLIADTTEWYDPRQVTGGRLNPTWVDSEIRMRVMQVQVGNVLAISHFLQEYYERVGCHVLRVPPLSDMAEADQYRKLVSVKHGAASSLHLVYAGDPGRKDLVGNVIRAIDLLGNEGRNVFLTLVGPTTAEIRHLLGTDGALLDTLEHQVICCGRRPHDETLAVIAAADFTLLLRPVARFASAGFSTKFVESLSLGVPVIANLTGDIGAYLSDGQEGIVLSASTTEACLDGIQRVLAMPREQWQEMRERARFRAECSFSYDLFVKPLKMFIEAARVS